MIGSAHIFTYGSLMFEPVWNKIVSARYQSVPAQLPNFCRLGIRGETYPATVPAPDVPGAVVSGRLWLDVQAPDLARLDAFEGTEYRRESVVVQTDPGAGLGAQLPAQCYVWLDSARLLATDWDVAGFEREHLAQFAQQHGGAGRSGR